MKRHNHPTTRNITIPSYTTKTYDWVMPAISGTTTYRWSYMTNTYNTSSSVDSKTAVATLMFHCGVGAEMDYKETGSSSFTRNAALALIKYFNYDLSIQYVRRNYHSNSDWETILRMEINAGRPIYYAGYGSEGHAFVCDGYDESGRFHFNWGWGGSQDGYFVTTTLNPGTDGTDDSEAFNHDQEILINIKPNSGGAKYNDIKITAETNISTEKTTLYRGESFVVNAPVKNQGLFSFNGDVGIAMVDANDNILSVIGQQSLTLDPNFQYSDVYSIRATIPTTTATGNCLIRVVYKSSDESKWSIVRATLGFTDLLKLAVTTNPHNIRLVNN